MVDKLNFDKSNGLIPAVVQDDRTGKVLMVGFMNKEAVAETMDSGKVTFYSRTKKRLWTKGETSGNFLEVRNLIPDCDFDTLLIKARPAGPVCHLGSDTCFKEENQVGFGLKELEKVIADRKVNPEIGSYTSQLIESGIGNIARKVGEEAVELILEAVDGKDNLFLNESADLLYHIIVLLQSRGHSLESVEKVLEERHNG